MCKGQQISQQSKEIDKYPQVERVFHLYKSFLELGKQVRQLQEEGKADNTIT